MIQVIGETSNKSAELKKFVQTFVLAQQPTGYFVLNDIFRYINEEADEEVDADGHEDMAQPMNQEQLAEGVEMPKSQPAAEEQAQPEVDAIDIVDKKLEESLDTAPTVLKDAPTTNGDETERVPEVDTVEEAPAAAAKPVEETPSPETVEKALEEEDVQAVEKPKDPVPSPAATRAPPTTAAVPAQPAVPAKPMSWANRAAAAAAVVTPPRPAVPNPKTSSPAPTPTRAPPATQPAQPAQTTQTSTAPVTSPTANKENEAPQSQNAGWQTAGSDHTKRQNRPQSVSGPIEKEGTMGYVRNVTEAVKADELKAVLSSYGELVYFDVNRQKVCNWPSCTSVSIILTCLRTAHLWSLPPLLDI